MWIIEMYLKPVIFMGKTKTVAYFLKNNMFVGI